MVHGVGVITTETLCHICNETVPAGEVAMYGTVRAKGSYVRGKSTCDFACMHILTEYHIKGAKATKRGPGKDDEKVFRHRGCHFSHNLLGKSVWIFQGFQELAQATQQTIYDEMKASTQQQEKKVPKLPERWQWLDPTPERKNPPTKKRRLCRN